MWKLKVWKSKAKPDSDVGGIEGGLWDFFPLSSTPVFLSGPIISAYWHMCVCVCMYIHICICMHLCMCVSTRVYVSVCTCVHACICLCLCLHLCVCVCVGQEWQFVNFNLVKWEGKGCRTGFKDIPTYVIIGNSCFSLSSTFLYIKWDLRCQTWIPHVGWVLWEFVKC